MNTTATFERRISGRRTAMPVVSLMLEELPSDEFERQGYLNHLRDFVDTHSPLPMVEPDNPLRPMTDDECRTFESEPMPFGKYKGISVGEVQLDYLDYLVGLTDPFKERVERYLINYATAAQLNIERLESEETP